MDWKKTLLRALPYIVAVVVFWAVSALYFAPQFSGKTLTMTDVQMYEGMKKDIADHRAITGEDPQWTGGMFGGMPAYLITVQYPAMFLRNGVQWLLGLLGEPMSLMFLAMLGFWLMLLMAGVNPWVAIAPAIAYGLSTYNILIIEAGHITKMRAMGYAPMLLGAVFWTFRRASDSLSGSSPGFDGMEGRAADTRRILLGGALAALFGALTIAASHHQITYYFLLVVIAYWINQLIVTIYDRRCITNFGSVAGADKSTGKTAANDAKKVASGADGGATDDTGKSERKGRVKAIRRRFDLATVVLLGAAVLAVGANFTHLWYTFEHSPETTRAGSEIAADATNSTAGDTADTAAYSGDSASQGLDLEYATAWSYGIGESLNMFIPNFRGGSSSVGFKTDGEAAAVLRKSGINPSVAAQLPGYWGTQPFTGGPTYIGAVIVFLFVLGMFMLRGREKWWVAAVCVLGLLLAWGRNAMWFTEFAFWALPGYNKFRTVSMALAILQWALPFVAALTLNKLWNNEFAADKKRFMHGLWWSLGITGGVALFFALFGGMIYDFSSASDGQLSGIPGLIDAVRNERAAMFRADCWRSLMFVALTGAIIWAWAVGFKGLRRWMPVAAIGVLVLADLVPVDIKYLSHSDFRTASRTAVTPDEVDLEIMADREPGFRVMNTDNPFNEAFTSYFHRSIGGYHGAKLRRYQDVIDRYLSKFDMEVLNMFNTKYFIVTDRETGERYAELNPDANGAAWMIDEVVYVNGAHEELDALGTIDNKRQAVVDERFAKLIANLSHTGSRANDGTKTADIESDTYGKTGVGTGSVADDVSGAESNVGPEIKSEIDLTEYQPNYLRYETLSATEKVAVFSEIYYNKGWKAYIDGELTDYFRADYILRGMVIPAGAHTVEWKFRAPHFAVVEGITLACSILVLLWLAAGIFRS